MAATAMKTTLELSDDCKASEAAPPVAERFPPKLKLHELHSAPGPACARPRALRHPAYVRVLG